MRMRITNQVTLIDSCMKISEMVCIHKTVSPLSFIVESILGVVKYVCKGSTDLDQNVADQCVCITVMML